MSVAGKLLNAEQLAIVRRRSDFRGLLAVGHAWAVIFGAMAFFVWWPNPLTFLLAVVVIGARQLGLAILMHDGAHGILCRNPKLNMFVSQWLCAYPMMAETQAYRRYHLTHHANTQQKDDPDLVLSAPFPITKKSFRRKMIRDLTGQTGYQQRKAQILNALGKSEWPLRQRLGNYWRKLGRATIAQAVIFAVLAASGHWYLYFALWLLPFLTWHQAITRVRNIAEHAMVPDDNDLFRNARTTKANWLERALIAPYWVNYHVEHHLMMWVPCYNLPKARAFLIANGYGARMESKGGYREVIRMATSKPDDQDKRGELVHNARKTRVQGVMSEGFKPAGDAAA
jgi:fatty acid desaturase